MMEIFIFLFALLVSVLGAMAFILYNIEMYLKDIADLLAQGGYFNLTEAASFEKLLKNKENDDE